MSLVVTAGVAPLAAAAPSPPRACGCPWASSRLLAMSACGRSFHPSPATLFRRGRATRAARSAAIFAVPFRGRRATYSRRRRRPRRAPHGRFPLAQPLFGASMPRSCRCVAGLVHCGCGRSPWPSRPRGSCPSLPGRPCARPAPRRARPARPLRPPRTARCRPAAPDAPSPPPPSPPRRRFGGRPAGRWPVFCGWGGGGRCVNWLRSRVRGPYRAPTPPRPCQIALGQRRVPLSHGRVPCRLRSAFSRSAPRTSQSEVPPRPSFAQLPRSLSLALPF